MKDDTLAIHISSSVISSRNNIDLKHIIKLIEDESDKHNPQEINNELELQHQNQDNIFSTRRDENLKWQENYGTNTPNILKDTHADSFIGPHLDYSSFLLTQT